jgi:hypothetical protein
MPTNRILEVKQTEVQQHETGIDAATSGMEEQ